MRRHLVVGVEAIAQRCIARISQEYPGGVWTLGTLAEERDRDAFEILMSAVAVPSPAAVMRAGPELTVDAITIAR
jgi:hypothetical protein